MQWWTATYDSEKPKSEIAVSNSDTGEVQHLQGVQEKPEVYVNELRLSATAVRWLRDEHIIHLPLTKGEEARGG